MTPAALALVGLTVLGTSFVSGIFGMAGGLILLGVLLLFMDVVPAMILFGIIQMGANGWRALLWRAHVRWGLVGRYLVGATASFLVMRLVAFVPDKALVYIGLGVLPFAAEMLPVRYWPDITKPGGPFLCGAVIMVLQLLAGAAGHILDMFFQRSQIDRKGIVGTKAVCQTTAHLFRVLYFGSLAGAFEGHVPPWAIVAALGLAFTGTSLAARVLERMSEADFRAWSRRIVHAVAATFLARGLWLLVAG
ncbi:MAG: TSUP family transporter [Hyphomicrobiaceae bacterium]|nr:TSUP family transporter [Hyphomicrobiaceae bacterium]